MKSRYMERWRENGNEKTQHRLNAAQNGTVQHIEAQLKVLKHSHNQL